MENYQPILSDSEKTRIPVTVMDSYHSNSNRRFGIIHLVGSSLVAAVLTFMAVSNMRQTAVPFNGIRTIIPQVPGIANDPVRAMPGGRGVSMTNVDGRVPSFRKYYPDSCPESLLRKGYSVWDVPYHCGVSGSKNAKCVYGCARTYPYEINASNGSCYLDCVLDR